MLLSPFYVAKNPILPFVNVGKLMIVLQDQVRIHIREQWAECVRGSEVAHLGGY